jgi:hypothetical protein
MFLGPSICVFVGSGVQYLIDRRRSKTRRSWYRFAAYMFLLCVIGGLTRDLAMRWRELRAPGIRGTLADANRRLEPDGQFMLLNDPGISAVFSYYITRGVGHPVSWSSEAPGKKIPGGKLALVAVKSNNVHQDFDALLRRFRQRVGRPVKIIWSQTAREVLLDHKDEITVWLCE